MRKLQIGVIGSTADLKYTKKLEKTAVRIGKLIAKSGNILMYGAEKDYDSLPTIAARAAKKADGLTIGITYGKGKEVYDEQSADVIVCSGLERGGGREFVLVNSCDVVIAISGGSGTLNEIAIAYQLGIPVICLKGFGGWGEKLAGIFLDKRKRLKCLSAATPKEAVKLAINAVQKNYKK